MIFEHTNYRDFLRGLYLHKNKSNSQYSMRAFASYVGLSSGGLSRILKGEKNLSQERAIEISQNLKLTAEETDYFSLLVQLERARSEVVKSHLLDQINRYRTKAQVVDLNVDLFNHISHWYNLAIFELLDLDGFDFSVGNISKFLGIKKVEAEVSIERLLRLELIELTEVGYKKTCNRLMFESAIPNKAIRNYYKQILNKSIASVDEQDPTEKVIGAEVFAFDSEDLQKAQKITYDYLDEMSALSKKSKNKQSIYQLAVQFFRLNNKEN